MPRIEEFALDQMLDQMLDAYNDWRAQPCDAYVTTCSPYPCKWPICRDPPSLFYVPLEQRLLGSTDSLA